MSKNKKILLGILTFLPLVFLIIYLVVFFTFFASIPFEEPHIVEDDPATFIRAIFGAVIWIFIAALLGLAMMIYYLMHASRNVKIKETERIIWILVLVFANTVGSIVYFFMHIVPLEENSQDTEVQNYNG